LRIVHEDDGIQNSDDFLSRWWAWFFYLSIILGVVFFGYYHFSGQRKLAGPALKVHGKTPAVATVPAMDAPTLAQGRKIFMTHCFACHTSTGAGLSGPNMTDAYWLHGATFEDSVRVVTKGIPGKGMISWEPILPPGDIFAVNSYMYSLRGTKPPNSKKPQGEFVEGSDSPIYVPGATPSSSDD
jgi:cytochrome c oxidase cbb3-type subunit 3